LRHRSLLSRCPIPLAAAAALLLATGAASAERVRIALLPVLVHSHESRDYLQQGLSDMLVARLGRDPRLAVIEVEEAAAATSDAEAARAAARSAGGAWVVFGSFTRFGEGASLDLQVARVGGEDGEPQRVFAQATTLGALIPMLDGVSERITARVLGGDAGVAPVAADGAPSGGSSEVAELRRRVEALERAVDQLGAARMPEEPKAAPAVQPSERPAERE
jgi:outer membrane protein insertion porin family